MASAAPKPHVMVLPLPAQGHVIPLMELSHRLVDYGFKIDFINTEFNHDRIFKSMQNKGAIPEGIHMISIPDGMDPADDRTDIGKMVGGLSAAMLGPLEEMIRTRKTKWVIADVSMSWVLELTNTVGVRIALFSTYSASVFALRMRLPKLIEDGVIDESGKKESNQLSHKFNPCCHVPLYNQRTDRYLGSPAKGTVTPLSRLLHDALWVELHDGSCAARCPILVLPLLR